MWCDVPPVPRPLMLPKNLFNLILHRVPKTLPIQCFAVISTTAGNLEANFVYSTKQSIRIHV